MSEAAEGAWMYGDPESHDLRIALANHHGVGPENIMIGEGIDSLLGYLVRLLIGPGDGVVTSLGAYPTFNYHVTGYGGVVHACPYRNDTEDLDALLQMACSTSAKIIYLANPDNPMGTWHSGDAINAMIKDIPDGCLLLLDEAYVEFAPANTSPPIDTTNPSVIVMRTFSKAYGMAGARVGYAIGHADLIGAFDKVRNHFGMSRISQAGALAALKDQCYLRETLKKVATARGKIAEIAKENGLLALPSATNFVTIDCMKDGDYARAALANLIEQDIFVRMPGVSPLDRCIRVSCGTDDDMKRFGEALPRALSKANKTAG